MSRHRDRGRPLTPGELALADETFGPALDAARVRLHHARWWPLQPRELVMAPDGDIWVPPGSTAWRDDYAVAPLHLQALFVHELVHCWQAQRGGRLYLPLARHPFCHYRYRFRHGRPFARYGIEEQAELIAHAFLLRRGQCVPGAPDLPALEAIIPFGRAARADRGSDPRAGDRA